MTDSKQALEQILNTGTRRTHWGRWLAAALVAAGAAGGWWWFGPVAEEKAQIRYETAEARTGNLVITVSATGTIEPTDLVEISSELSGTIAEVLVDFNDPVEVGQVLARLDATKLEAQLEVQTAQVIAAEARVEQAQATLTQAAENYESAAELESRGVTSHQAFVSARTAYDSAIAALQIADADRNLSEAQLDMQKADLAKAVLTAPIAGIVLVRDVDPGQIVAASLSAPVLFTIAGDLSQMELQVDVDEADIGRISVGDHATFTVDAFDEVAFPAEIAKIRFAPETIDGVVTYKAVLKIENAELLLRPGMTAVAEITVAAYEGVLMVPNAALRYAPPQALPEEEDSGGGLLGMLMPRPEEQAGAVDRNTVWVLEAGVAREIAVTTGDTDGKFTIIEGGGLSDGTLVITDQSGGR